MPSPSAPAPLTDLGPQVLNGTVHAATLGNTSRDRHILYAVFDGAFEVDARLVLIDLNDCRVLAVFPIPGAHSSWACTTAKDGSVFIGSNFNGRLYRYVPGANSVLDLGEPVQGDTYVFAVASGRGDIVYGGTFPGARLFSYSPAQGFTLLGEGSIHQGEQYIRSLAYDSVQDIVYAGLGAHAKLVRYDCRSGVTEQILPDLIRDEFVYSLNLTGGRLFVRLHPTHRTHIFRVNGAEAGCPVFKPESVLERISSLGVSDDYEGRVYYTSEGELHCYVLGAKEAQSLGIHTGIDPVMLSWVQRDEQTAWPGKTLVGIGSKCGQTRIFGYNPHTSQFFQQTLEVETSPTTINSLVKGPDGRLYSSGYLVGGAAAFDPLHFTSEQLRGMGQAEGTAVIGSRIYFGLYPGAVIFEYDTGKPWTLDRDGDNPKPLFALKDEGQDRPYGMAAGGKKLYIGTVPGYGRLGGALVEYDPETGALEVHKDIAGGLSLVSMVYDQGKVYAGTSIFGGLGVHPSETEADLLVWHTDVKKAERVSLGLPGVKEITALAVHLSGQVWGMADGYLFVYAPAEKRVVWKHQVFPGYPHGYKAVWRDASLLFGRDGSLYGTTRAGRALFRLHNTNCQLEILDDTGAFLLAEDDEGALYYSDGAVRMKRYVPDTNRLLV